VRAGADNSVNLIHIDAAATERAVVERWDHDPAQGAFVPRERHRLLAPVRDGEDRCAGPASAADRCASTPGQRPDQSGGDLRDRRT
jgi:hypothetical protein